MSTYREEQDNIRDKYRKTISRLGRARPGKYQVGRKSGTQRVQLGKKRRQARSRAIRYHRLCASGQKHRFKGRL